MKNSNYTINQLRHRAPLSINDFCEMQRREGRTLNYVYLCVYRSEGKECFSKVCVALTRDTHLMQQFIYYYK